MNENEDSTCQNLWDAVKEYSEKMYTGKHLQ